MKEVVREFGITLENVWVILNFAASRLGEHQGSQNHQTPLWRFFLKERYGRMEGP